MVSVSRCLKVMHKKVLNLEFHRIDVHTFLTFYPEFHMHALSTVTLQRSNINKTVTILILSV